MHAQEKREGKGKNYVGGLTCCKKERKKERRKTKSLKQDLAVNKEGGRYTETERSTRKRNGLKSGIVWLRREKRNRGKNENVER